MENNDSSEDAEDHEEELDWFYQHRVWSKVVFYSHESVTDIVDSIWLVND